MKPTSSLASSSRAPSSHTQTSKQSSAAPPRLTRAQRQIHHLLEQESEAMTAQAIYQRLKAQQKPVGLATVYRSLRSLQIKGLAQARALPNGEWMYTLARSRRVSRHKAITAIQAHSNSLHFSPPVDADCGIDLINALSTLLTDSGVVKT